MNRTQGIFLFASIVVGLAVVLTLRQPPPSAIQDPPPRAPGVTSPSTGSSDGAVSLATHISHPYVYSDQTTDVFLQIDIQGKAGPKMARLPLDIALVIDRSGSMAGRKLLHAKTAARRLVERLHEGDHIAVVTYGSDVTLLVPSQRIDATSRAQILARIDTITDRGGTFLSGGLQTAAAALRRTFTTGHVTRVILISDGQANEGIITKRGLTAIAQTTARGGISVTTMGVGLDFNEDVMTAIAEHGNGHYYFIKDATSLASIFNRELEKMMATVARGPSLKIALEPDVELLSVYGYDYTRHDRRLDISLPDLFAKQHRRVTLKLRVPRGATAQRLLAQVSLRYADIKSQIRSLASQVVVTPTTTRALVERHRQRDVLARGQEVELARTMTSALDTYRAGHVVAAQAQLRRRLRQALSANKRLRSKALERSIINTRQLLDSTAAAPSSATGRALIKAGKARARRLAK